MQPIKLTPTTQERVSIAIRSLGESKPANIVRRALDLYLDRLDTLKPAELAAEAKEVRKRRPLPGADHGDD